MIGKANAKAAKKVEGVRKGKSQEVGRGKVKGGEGNEGKVERCGPPSMIQHANSGRDGPNGGEIPVLWRNEE